LIRVLDELRTSRVPEITRLVLPCKFRFIDLEMVGDGLGGGVVVDEASLKEAMT
jgi:hypothetical protein